MCIVFTCGEHTFRKEVKGYEGQICRCHNCGNYSGRVIKSNPWFTFCFIPIVPLSMKGYQEVSCHICHFNQPLSHRPDVQPSGGGAGSGPGPHGEMPMHPPGPPPPHAHGAAGGWAQQPPGQQPMRYG